MSNPPIIATMCMLADRYPRSLPCVLSLKGQVDVLYLCLNNFWQIPSELRQDWIKVLHLGENLGDAARFYLLKNLDLANGHIVSCDDDIEYPGTYVKDFLDAHQKYPDALLTHNGLVFMSHSEYHSSLPVYHDGVVRNNYKVQFYAENSQASYLDVGGSGVSFIPKLIFEQFSFNSLVHLNKVDIHLACNAKKLGVSIIGLPHPKNYFHPIHHPNNLSRLVRSNPKLSRERTRKIYASYGLDFDDPTIPS